MKKEDINIGGVIDKPGSSKNNKTGGWREKRPVIDRDKCKGCGKCWEVCPDNAIKIKDGKVLIDFRYCKGCGICANECPLGAIKMEVEKK